jgi:hypothetical protein
MDPSTVIAGLDPATPINEARLCLLKRDGRVEPGHDDSPEGIISNDVSYDISFVNRASQQK